MHCPQCHHELEAVDVGGIHIDRCPNCEGMWFDKGELRVLKDRQAGRDYEWIHLDLWRDMEKFRAAQQDRYSCPRDGASMTTVHYDKSNVAIDVCPACDGIWLDKEGYQELLSLLEETVNASSEEDYLKDVREELARTFEGRENPVEALRDIGKILYLLELRFTVDHPTLAKLSVAFPRF